MTGLPTVATILAGFPAGFVALLAPCCFAVLLAAYFSRFTHERDRMVRMTLVFATGIWLVYLVPTIVTAALAKSILGYHMWVYKLGGVFMLLLAAMLLMGYRVMMPKPAWLKRRSLEGQRAQGSYEYGSVLTLGVVSGLSTLCCAPVFASVLALSAAPGSIPVALAAELYFVLGMTLPLFVIAIVADREGLRRRLRDLQKKPAVEYRLGKKHVALSWGDVLASVLYIVFGLFMLLVAEGMGAATADDLEMNMRTLRITAWLATNADFLPLWSVVLFPFVAVGVIYLVSKFKQEKADVEESNSGKETPAGDEAAKLDRDRGHVVLRGGTGGCCR